MDVSVSLYQLSRVDGLLRYAVRGKIHMHALKDEKIIFVLMESERSEASLL